MFEDVLESVGWLLTGQYFAG